MACPEIDVGGDQKQDYHLGWPKVVGFTVAWEWEASFLTIRSDSRLRGLYHSDVQNTIQLSPPIKFGKQSCYDTRTAPYFAAPNWYRLLFNQNFFRSKGILVE